MEKGYKIKRPIIYISGKITGDKNYKRKFKRAERKLKREGYKVFNPCCIPAIFNSWAEYILIDLAALESCDFIYMLPDWKESQGARLEYEYASKEGKGIIFA